MQTETDVVAANMSNTFSKEAGPVVGVQEIAERRVIDFYLALGGVGDEDNASNFSAGIELYGEDPVPVEDEFGGGNKPPVPPAVPTTPDYLPDQNGLDYFLAHPPRQPKREIADYVESEYVESEEVLVPHRFDSLADALASDTLFIVRSEHPHEYDGMSGILDSYRVSSSRIEAYARKFQQMKEHIHTRREEDVDPVLYALSKADELPQEEFERLLKLRLYELDYYCRLKGFDPEKFKSEITYSYWQMQQGDNRTIIADSAVKNRYHILSHMKHPDPDLGYMRVWATVERGKVLYQTTKIDTLAAYDRLIRFYEAVRNLPRFNGMQCPAIECQTDGRNAYFLQYHRTREFSGADFELDDVPPEGMIPATFVRGRTPKEGITENVRIAFPDSHGKLTSDDLKDNAWGFLPFTEREGMHWAADNTAVEAGSKSFSAIILAGDNEILRYAENRHLMLSTVFNPGVFLIVDPKKLRANVGDTSGKMYLPMKILSDGRRAYIKLA